MIMMSESMFRNAVEAPLTANSPHRPPVYNGHFTLSRRTVHTLTLVKTSLQRQRPLSCGPSCLNNLLPTASFFSDWRISQGRSRNCIRMALIWSIAQVLPDKMQIPYFFCKTSRSNRQPLTNLFHLKGNKISAILNAKWCSNRHLSLEHYVSARAFLDIFCL